MVVEQGCIVIPVELLVHTDTGAVDTHGTVNTHIGFAGGTVGTPYHGGGGGGALERLAQMEIVTLQVAMGVMVSIMYGV